MKKWVTEIAALEPTTGILKKWAGPYVTAETWEGAEKYCQENGLGYCEIVGQLTAEIDENTGVVIDFDNLN